MAANMVDLVSLAEKWAKDYFRNKASGWRERRLVDKDRLGITLDWKRVRFDHSEPLYEAEMGPGSGGVPRTNCLFHTTYTNKMNTPQKYNFKGERTTTSSCSIDIEEGYTQNYEVGISLKTPCEILEVNAGFSHELSVNKATGTAEEEQLSWGVDSEIEVAGRHKAVAKMMILEEEHKSTFTLKTNVQGVLHVVFTNLRDNNSFVRAADVDIFELVFWAKEERLLPRNNVVTLEQSTKEVILTTRGKCNFKYGLKQDIEVEQMPLE